MASRITALAFALVILLGTGVGRGMSYLCLMNGQARTTCCCKHTKGEPRDGAAFERNQRCCELQVSAPLGTPVVPPDGTRVELASAPAECTATSLVIDLPAALATEVTPTVRARAPPRGPGPPIFIRNCSYLI